jgi:hypothetical protein
MVRVQEEHLLAQSGATLGFQTQPQIPWKTSLSLFFYKAVPEEYPTPPENTIAVAAAS